MSSTKRHAVIGLFLVVGCGGPGAAPSKTVPATTPVTTVPQAATSHSAPESPGARCAGLESTPGPVDERDWLLIDARKTTAMRDGGELVLEPASLTVVSPNGAFGAVIHRGVLRVFDLGTRAEIAWPATFHSVDDVQLGTGFALVKTVVASGPEVDLTLVEIASGRAMAKQRVNRSNAVWLSRDGTRFAVQTMSQESIDTTVRIGTREPTTPDDVLIVSTTTGEHLAKLENASLPTLGPYGRVFGTWVDDNMVIRTPRGTEVHRQPFDGATQGRAGITFSRNGARAAFAMNGSVHVIELPSAGRP